MIRHIVLTVMVTLTMSVMGQHAVHSVLSDGEWWKIGVNSDGLYRISAVELPALLGSKVDDIAVFGHKGMVMELDNSIARIDDLEEMAIEVHDGNGNGVMESDDYILLYASGPGTWKYDSHKGQYVYQSNPYSSENYVFLSIKKGSHRRISIEESQQPTGGEIATGHIVLRHERDLVNTHRTGQIWVGEKFFGSTLRHTVNFSLPATATSVKARYGLASISSASSSFTVTINGSSAVHSFSKNSRYGAFARQIGVSSNDISVDIQYNNAESMAEGYLDFVEIDAEVSMSMSGLMTLFRIPATDDSVHTFVIHNATSGLRLWDVSDYNNVKALSATTSGGGVTFTATPQSDLTFMAFLPTAAAAPATVEKIACQDLHGSDNPDMVIVSNAALMPQARRLASLHSIMDDMEVLVVAQEEVFNEFSCGRRDPMAIRELLRMFNRRASADASQKRPRHLLLFGKGTYDNRNLLGSDITDVVTYQTEASFNDEGNGSMATDDMFTFLGDNETGSMYESLDVGVGRLPAKDIDEARHIVDKIERYMTRADLLEDGIRGDWRNTVALLADDADPGIPGDTNFTWSSEVTARQISSRYPHLTIDKIYADAYQQQSGADGSYYPDVNNALKKRMDYGCLLLNYIGHGSSQYIGTERFMMKSDIAKYANIQQLSFFVTSTCTFGRYDDPEESCGAEEFLLSDGAGIGCLAASRPISHIQTVNTAIVMQCLDPANTIGEGIRRAKNERPTTQALTLMGDPALRLSLPKYRVVVTAVNGRAVDSTRTDTALVLSTVHIEGEIRDSKGNLVEDFDGRIFPEVYDRPKSTHTLANDNEGCAVSFTQQNNLLYKGSAKVEHGHFSYHFVVPRDVAYTFGRCRIAHYAKSAVDDAAGAYQNILLGGYDQSAVVDEHYPTMRLYINDTNFRNGGISGSTPTLLVMLNDSVGINSVGSGLGHDITATLDGNPNNIIVLNDLYEPDIDDDHSGTIRYTYAALLPGRHTISVKAWNIFNMSTTGEISFVVRDTAESVSQFHAMPNPATDRVWIRLETNASLTTATLDIYDLQGRRVASFTPPVSPDSYVAGPVVWDLTYPDGTRVGRGVFVARFTATTSDGDKVVENGKIIVR